MVWVGVSSVGEMPVPPEVITTSTPSAMASRSAWHNGPPSPTRTGAADENAALAALGHITALRDDDIRIRVARWLRDLHSPAASGPSPYWDGSLPDALADELVAAVVTPRFLIGLLMETTQEQDRRALTVLARAAATRPELRVCLTELLSVLPGLSPVAIDVALSGGYP